MPLSLIKMSARLVNIWERYLNVLSPSYLWDALCLFSSGLDLKTSAHLSSIDLYTELYYFTIVTWKTAYYTIVQPVICGLAISHLSSLAEHPALRPLLVDIGIYFQVQDDYLDCFGDVNITGKIGTDIQDHKCSWLIVQAMKLLNDETTRQILRDNYGQKDQMKVDRVKQVYTQLNLQQVYETYEQKTHENIVKRIKEANFDLKELEQLLTQLLYSIRARNN
jgi:farnesyl diphosphate synthase